MFPIWKGSHKGVTHYTGLLEGETSDTGWRVLLCKEEDEEHRITHKLPDFTDHAMGDNDVPITCLQCIALSQQAGLDECYVAWREEIRKRLW